MFCTECQPQNWVDIGGDTGFNAEPGNYVIYAAGGLNVNNEDASWYAINLLNKQVSGGVNTMLNNQPVAICLDVDSVATYELTF